ncbi:MAG: trypsin-like peptidase domain-containing protein [Candidatus Omnitrophica bacterium]|nr:trypsin-like peptidase domain-containing protein [Candidatus Omnitrophota bacterium]
MIDNKGLIITNAHVVNGATAIQVVFADKKELPALVVGRNDAEDLALLELADPEVDLSSFSQAVNFGDSEKIQVGEEVFAIGNPLGYKHTVTKGILSAKSREVMDGSRVVMKEMLQTDASINPGNSGCPLFDANGKMVGLVTLKDSRADRIGFAIPVNRIKQILPELKAQNKNDITRLEKFCDRFGFVPGETRNAGGTRRVEILNVNKNAAAEKTGIQSGDVILGFQNQKIGDVNDLLEKASEIKSGERISIIIQRNEKIFFTYMVAK